MLHLPAPGKVPTALLFSRLNSFVIGRLFWGRTLIPMYYALY